MATQSGQLLTVAEVCQRLKIGKSKLFELLATGEIGSLKIDGSRRFTEGQVAEFIQSRIDAEKVPA